MPWDLEDFHIFGVGTWDESARHGLEFGSIISGIRHEC